MNNQGKMSPRDFLENSLRIREPFNSFFSLRSEENSSGGKSILRPTRLIVTNCLNYSAMIIPHPPTNDGIIASFTHEFCIRAIIIVTIVSSLRVVITNRLRATTETIIPRYRVCRIERQAIERDAIAIERSPLYDRSVFCYLHTECLSRIFSSYPIESVIP